ncbi:MAG: DNA adenine methylase [Terriglobia bacterium]
MANISLSNPRKEAASRAPFLKWPGGKRKLVRHILPLLPTKYNRYYEPFLGSAALFFALRPPLASLSDKNCDLVSVYNQVRNDPQTVMDYLRRLTNSEKSYYLVRSTIPTSEAERAARLIYLSTLSFNGIHRVNLKGKFNVPYGYKTHLTPCVPEKINTASELLRKATIKWQDFEDAVKRARRGDLLYLDPPYTVAHGNNGFLKYNAKIFSWDDQTRLAKVAHALANKGCSVFVSNANHPSIRKMYQDFQVLEIKRHSVIAASSEFRRAITECVFYNQ